MTALCSGKICTIFPEKGALNFWKACTIALEYSQNIKELFKGCDKNYHNIFVHNINDVLHGNCIDIDEKSLKKYDEYVLSYLKMISLSKRSKEK